MYCVQRSQYIRPNLKKNSFRGNHMRNVIFQFSKFSPKVFPYRWDTLAVVPAPLPCICFEISSKCPNSFAKQNCKKLCRFLMQLPAFNITAFHSEKKNPKCKKNVFMNYYRYLRCLT